MRKLIKISAVLLAIIFPLVPSPAFALEPPEEIYFNSVQVVRNTVESGDIAIAFYFNTSYETYPTDVSASDAVIIRLYDTDGSTLLATGSPYSLFDGGYGPQVSGFYFDADEVAALGLTWNQPYVINITYSEAYVEEPPEEEYEITTADYSTPTDQEENQLAFTSWIFGICDNLETARPLYTLHGSTDAGVVLTDIGELYFRGALEGIQSVAPSLFFLQFITPSAVSVNYTANMTSFYGGRLTGTDVMTGFERIGAHLGVTGDFALATFFFIVAICLVLFTSYKGWGAEPGLLMAGNWLTMGALLAGNEVMVLRMVLAFLAGIMLFYVMLFRRA